MKLIIDIPEVVKHKVYAYGLSLSPSDKEQLIKAILNGTPIPDNATNGKEVLIKYCLEHSGEEIYDLLKRVFDASMSWTDSRGFIIEWLEKGIRNEKDTSIFN